MAKRLESLECIKFNNWLKANSVHWPILEMIHHIPNEGKRSHKTGAELKAMGLRDGVADYVLFAGGHVLGFNEVVQGLAIEMKTAKGKQSESQVRWQKQFEHFGGKYYLCRSATEAAAAVKSHLGLTLPRMPGV